MSQINVHAELIKLQMEIINYEGKDNSKAIELFKEFLTKVESLGYYTVESWPIFWTESVWDFAGNLQNKTRTNARILNYIGEVKGRINSTTRLNNNVESLEFVLNELTWNQLSSEQADSTNNLSHDLHKKYPNNCEFKFSYAHVLAASDNLEEAIPLYRKCITIWKNPSQRTLSMIGHAEYKLAKKYLRQGKYNEASEIIKNASKSPYYFMDQTLQTMFFNFEEEKNDKKSFHELIKKVEESLISAKNNIDQKVDDLKNNLEEKLEKENKSSLDNLGIFSAVIAFILTAATTATGKANIELALPVLLAIGGMLISFVLAISCINHRSKDFFKDGRFVLVIFQLLMVIAIWHFYPTKTTEVTHNATSSETSETSMKQRAKPKSVTKKDVVTEVEKKSE